MHRRHTAAVPPSAIGSTQEELWDVNKMDDPAAATRRLAFVVDMKPRGVELRGLVLPSGAAPLHIACNCRHPAVVGLLIRQLAERGADLEAVWQPGFDPDHAAIGLTPLLAATGNPSADAAVAAISALLSLGADIRVMARRHPHKTALMMAALRHAAALESLLAAGANVHVKDADGQTALHHAVRYRNLFGGGRLAVSALLAAGSDPLAVCASGMTPRRWAEKAYTPDPDACFCLCQHFASVQVSRGTHAEAAAGPTSQAKQSPDPATVMCVPLTTLLKRNLWCTRCCCL